MKAFKNILDFCIINFLVSAIFWKITGITFDSSEGMGKYLLVRILTSPTKLVISAFLFLIPRLIIFQKEKNRKNQIHDTVKNITIAKINDAYWLILFGIILSIFALSHLLDIKTLSDYFLVAMLGFLSYLFVANGFRVASLTHDESSITICTLRHKFTMPFIRVLSIKRGGAVRSNAGILFQYKVTFVTETGENIHLTVRVSSRGFKELAVLASLIKLTNPNFLFEDLI